MKSIRAMKQHPIIVDLKDETGAWKDVHIVATDRFDPQVIEFFAGDLKHLSNADGSPHAEPEVIELWLGVDYPLRDAIDFRILAASARGLWIDGEMKGRIGSQVVLLPWSSVFTVHIHNHTALTTS